MKWFPLILFSVVHNLRFRLLTLGMYCSDTSRNEWKMKKMNERFNYYLLTHSIETVVVVCIVIVFVLYCLWKSFPLFVLAWRCISRIWQSVAPNVKSKSRYLQVKLKINPQMVEWWKAKTELFLHEWWIVQWAELAFYQAKTEENGNAIEIRKPNAGNNWIQRQ